MKTIALVLMLFSYLTLSGQNCISYLENFSNNFGVQFAYDPDQMSALSVTEEWETAKGLEDLKELFATAKIEVAEIEKNRWLLRKKPPVKQGSTFIRGRVLEGDEEPLVGALIYTKDGSYAALTDELGAFILEIPSEVDCEICCQFLGYKVACVQNSDFLQFNLEPTTILIDNVEISSKKIQFNIVNAGDGEVLQIKNAEMNKAALGRDVVRTVQLLGGVDATDDLSASMVVRASSGMQSLVTLDGIPLYNPESAFGMFSVLNPLVVTKATLYKNSMPLEYGEFTGAYLACEGLTTMEDKVRYNLDLNTLFTASSIQIPVGKSTQISGAFRRSNGRISNQQYYSRLQSRRSNNQGLQQFFQRPESIKTGLENQFGDLYLNISHEAKKDRNFTFSIFGNRDLSGSTYEGNYEVRRVNPGNRFEVLENYKQEKSKANLGLSFTYTKDYLSGADFKIQFYSSNYKLSDDIVSNITIKREENEKSNNFDSQIINNVRDSNLKFQFQTSQQKAFSLKTGLDLRRISTDFLFRSIDVTGFRQNLEVPVVTPYWGLSYHKDDILFLQLGMRSAIIPAERLIAFTSPRARARVKINDYLFIKSSLSYNQQFFRPIELERQLGQSTSANIISTRKNIPVLKSTQGTLGWQYGRESFKLNGDFFVRRNEGILEQALSRPGLSSIDSGVFGNNSYELFQGTNAVAGLDLTASLEKGNLYGLVSYTYSKSEDQFPRLFNNRAIVDQNNRLNQVNVFGAYSFDAWTLSSTYVYGSGIYTLDRSALENNIDRAQVEPSDLFRQLPSYKRWDISVSYKWPAKIGDVHFDLGIVNVLDHKNVNSEIDIYTIQETNQTALGAAQIELLGRIWTLGIRFEL